MSSIPFSRAFSVVAREGLPFSEGAMVEKMRIISAKREIEAEIRFLEFLSFEDFQGVKNAIIEAYSLTAATIFPVFEGHDPGREFLGYIHDFIMREHRPVMPIIEEAEVLFEGDRVVFELPAASLDFAASTGVARDLGVFLSALFGRRITAELTGGSERAKFETEDFERLVAQKEREAIESAMSEAPREGAQARKPAAQKQAEPRRPRRQQTAVSPGGEVIETSENDRVLMGRAIKGGRTKVSEITAESGNVNIMIEIFHVEMTPAGRSLVWFNMDGTDYTGSIRVKRRMPESEGKALEEAFSKGGTAVVSGIIEFDPFYDDLIIRPSSVVAVDRRLKPRREDGYPEKRIELHMHTSMSAMDATAGVKELIGRAADFGHPAVAITDHGGVQAFPEAMNAAAALKKKGKEIKVIYGLEAYYVVDSDSARVFAGKRDLPLSGEWVCFDVETTGMNPENDALTEIGAVKIKNGVAAEEFSTFVDPERPIPDNIIELTGITDEMVRGAPSQDEAVRRFLEFAGDLPLVAHNAAFDIGFVEGRCPAKREFDYIDTLELSRILLPKLARHRLNSLASHFKVEQKQHHRANDDARVLCGIFSKLMAEFRAKRPDIESTGCFNTALTDIMLKNRESEASFKGMPVYHLIILAKNLTGLKNLYRLVSRSNIDFLDNRKRPLIPKSLLQEHRAGLFIGSACEAGELYTAARDGADHKKLLKIARFYDFLEIQPNGNNEFLIREGRVKSEEDLKVINRKIVSLADELKKPCVATGDVHFLDPEDAAFRAVAMNAKGFQDAEKQPPLFFKTTEEMLNEFSYLGPEKAREVVIENPKKIADMCGEIRPVPIEQAPPVIDGSAEELESICRARFKELYGDNPAEIISERFEIELTNIIKHGYDVMYISAQKLVSRSIEQGYLVGSRGSVGSSFVAYLAGITEVNALPPHYRCPGCKRVEFTPPELAGCGADLPDSDCPECGIRMEKDGFSIPFATFLGFEADKTPDIDLNFSGEYQARAHAHTEEIFGKGFVFRAGTIGTVAEKTAVGYAKKYAEDKGLDINKAEIMRLAKGCEGVRRTSGQHPGGVMVVPRTRDIYDFSPIQYPADDRECGIITTHFDYHAIHDNLLKLDILGHDDPTMIRMLQDLTGVNPMKIPLDDKDTLSIFTTAGALGYEPDGVTGETGAIAIPEFGTKNTRQMLIETRPSTVDGLIRICGLAHGTNVWRNNAQDIIKKGTATLDNVICARDDIMEYLIRMGLEHKMSFAIMESVRKGKKLTPDWEKAMRDKKVPEWYIESCNRIEYMFPKAHAVAYVMMALRISWFKVHKPLEFYAAYFTIRAGAVDIGIMSQGDYQVVKKYEDLNSRRDSSTTANEKQLAITLEVCHEFYLRGFRFLPVDIYKSDAERFLCENGALRPPFTAIPGLGLTAAKDIVRERANGEFISVDEFGMRCRVSSTIIEAMKELGAFGDMAESAQMSLF